MEMVIENAQITRADLTMADYGCLTLSLIIEGSGWGISFGGYVLGKGYLGASEFTGSAKGIEEIMRIMDVVGVERFSELEGKYVRIEVPAYGSGRAYKIGNIIEDKWFDYREFYKKEKEDE